MKKSKSFTYAEAGVHIDTGNTFVERLKPHALRTMRPEILAGIGGFGAFSEIPKKYKEPILVSSTDGVGTKLLLAQQLNHLEHLGVDLVAMCVNDIVVSGAEPLFFLDYFATGHLELDTAETIIKSIAEGCLLAGCALVGGETAEMPGMYAKKDFDLAGFCVGVLEKSHIVRGDNITPSDCLIGLPSSGPHANGYSLIRALLKEQTLDFEGDCGGVPLKEALLAPTRVYVPAVLALHKTGLLKGAAHITGGGLLENIPRMFPKDAILQARLDPTRWEIPAVFHFLASLGALSQTELLRTFNNGIGMVLCVAENTAEKALECLRTAGENPILIGSIAARAEKEPDCVVIQDLPYGQS